MYRRGFKERVYKKREKLTFFLNRGTLNLKIADFTSHWAKTQFAPRYLKNREVSAHIPNYSFHEIAQAPKTNFNK
jgi:hypothetical protein